jgi:serine/threonine protein kinase
MTTIGNYDIVRLIGEGGFGRTYEARHRFLDEKACLKQNINVTDTDAELLRREAKLLWNVHHTSLPAMRDYFSLNDGSYALVMSFIEGKTLEHSVKKHTAIHPEDVCWMTQRILNALHYLHSMGIVHGDVKPNNIIVQPQVHNAVLVDYGLSSLRPKANSQAVGYTTIFAAPEIMTGKPPLPESDIYSLGLTLMYALGGDPVTKAIPDHVPDPIQKFCRELSNHNPLDRPNWDKQDLVARVSDIREEVFGRRHSRTRE